MPTAEGLQTPLLLREAEHAVGWKMTYSDLSKDLQKRLTTCVVVVAMFPFVVIVEVVVVVVMAVVVEDIVTIVEVIIVVDVVVHVTAIFLKALVVLQLSVSWDRFG